MIRNVTAVLRDLAASIAIWCRNPRCPWCGQRTPHIEAHMHIDHAHDPAQGGRP